MYHLNNKKDLKEFKRIMNSEIDILYKTCKTYECFDYYSYYGDERILTQNGLSERTLIVHELSLKYSLQLYNCAICNDFRNFRRYWLQLKPYLLN